MAGYGGETPLVEYGLTMTVEAPTGTDSTTPVNQGDLFKLSGTAADGSGYKVAAAAADDDPQNCILVMALHRMTSVGPMGVLVLGGYAGTTKFNYYTGAAPTIGQSIAVTASNVRKVKGIAWAAGKGYVTAVDTTNLMVEVLI